MSYLDKAKAIQDEVVAHRRYIHENAEVDNKLTKTTAYVMQELKKMGYEPKEICQSGVSVTVGKPGKCLLLRSDMDALPMKELSGLPYASKDDGAAHTCGHDLHTAILLGAAKLLKENEDQLEGTVKLMFQPAEETFRGAPAMIEAGILDNPKVDIAFGGHVTPRNKTGQIAIHAGPAMASCYGFKIKITGKGCHGAQPQTGVDPINIGSHIYLALQELIAREVSFQRGAILTIGSFNGGAAANIIPHTAEMQGTLRTFDGEIRQFLIGRIQEVVTQVAGVYRGTAEIEELSNVPVEYNDPAFTETVKQYAADLLGPDAPIENILITGSEDFAFVSEKVPTVFAFIGALDPNHQGEVFLSHHPKIVFDENCLPLGVALYAEVATRWLRENK